MNIFFRLLLPICFTLTSTQCLFSQFNFLRNGNVLVIDDSSDTLTNPWAGGLNFVQFSEIDLNFDGLKDLFVFDRTGDKISTFINLGLTNRVSYTHDPSYEKFFPKMTQWALLRDHNCDGKQDIFTYSAGRIVVYENTSVGGVLEFTLNTNVLLMDIQPDQSPDYAPIFMSGSDIPAIDDIDNDGDLDILSFGPSGTHVVYHKNLSMERYGNCDSLDFQLANRCWGFFRESSSSNAVTLFDTCVINIDNPEIKTQGTYKHAGSSLLSLDVDSNNSKELVLGDVSYKNFVMLTNGDTTHDLTSSIIVAQDTNFPQNNVGTLATNIDIFPAGYYLDVNNDGLKDLIASPNCSNGCENSNNVWFYKNDGLDNFPIFNYSTDAFLQDGMIEVGEGAHPVFFDHNSDGLMDIIIGNYGKYNSSLSSLYESKLWLYENIGSISEPVFKLVDSDYADISSINLDINGNRPTLGISPAFGDLDGDGDLDMLLGDYNGYIHYFTNTSGPGNIASFSLTAAEFLGIDVGNNATPFLHHLDSDSLIDLVVGTSIGTFFYFKNTGTSSHAVFDFITDSLGKVDTRGHSNFYGNSNPVFVNDNGNTRLFSGSQNGYIYQFGNIDGNLTGTFSIIDSMFINIWEGVGSHISMADITNDGKLDMLVGNHSGGVAFYEGTFGVNIVENEKTLDFMIFPNPTNGMVTIDTGENNLKEATITVRDILGKIILVNCLEQKKTVLNLNNYPSGTYLIEFKSSSEHGVSKVVKR